MTLRMEDASGYIEFILRSMQSRDLFHSIRIEPTSCWEYLLWMDQVPFSCFHAPTFSFPRTPFQSNYGGVRVKLPSSLKTIYGEEEDDSEPMEEGVGVASTPTNEQEVEMNWNVCNFLPEAGSCQDIFRVMVAAHIHALHCHEAEGRRNHAPGSTPIQRRSNSTQSQVLCVCNIFHLSLSLSLSLPLSLSLSLLLSPSPSLPQFPPDSSVTPGLVSFAQQRIQTEITDKLFM